MEINSSYEKLWYVAKITDKIFFNEEDYSIKNPIICYQAVLVGCAITIITVREKRGTAASVYLFKYFSSKLYEYINENENLEKFASDNNVLVESQLNAFVEILSPGNDRHHLQILANNLFLNPQLEHDPLDELESFSTFSICIEGYIKMLEKLEI